MRLAFLAALAGGLITAHPAIGGEFPFTGYILAERAEVASGPGRRFYITDHLPRGATVEVYREDDAGWLAIRPPEGSFSWIPAEHVQRLDDGVGKVASPTASWVGTSIEKVEEHKSQVELKAGELVQVVAEKIVGEGDSQEKWLKIAPPAGEFRYVHSRDVSREKVEVDSPPLADAVVVDQDVDPVDDARERAGEPEEEHEPRRFRASDGAIALRDIDEVRSRLAVMRDQLEDLSGPRRTGSELQLAQYKSSAGTLSDRSLSPDGFVPRKRRATEQLGPVPLKSNRVTHSAPSASRSRLDPLPRIADARAGERKSYEVSAQPTPRARQRLDELELELSLMLAQDRSRWDLAALRQKVEELIATGSDPLERGQARLLSDKIKQFEDSFAAEGGVADAPAGPADEPAAGSLADPRYDAKGWLKPVMSKNKPIAPYAVVDESGQPLCFVTPSPGMNLGRYVNKQVGLYGRRGYIESLKSPHVTAQRVIDLERVR
jgi:hypothetical protein